MSSNQGNLNTLPFTQDDVAVAARKKARQTALAKKPDRSYTAAYNTLVKYVDEQRALYKLPMGEKYITRVNVDLFFLHHVSNLHASPAHCRRFVSGLQWYAD